MSLADVTLAIAWLGLTAYVLFGGADFGAGIWDLLAGRHRDGARERSLIAHTMGPFWEANHVWLIFVIVIMWSAFPLVFASVASTLYVPLTLVAVGIIFRGSTFVFRKEVADRPGVRRTFDVAFAASSILTPGFLGVAAGAIASDRVPVGAAEGEPIGSWATPTSIWAGAFAVSVCAYLASIYLCGDARRSGDGDLVPRLRRRALVTGAITGALAIGGLFVVRSDAPRLYDGLTGSAAWTVALSGAAGIASVALLVASRFTLVRLTAGLAVAAVLWGWGFSLHPELLPGLDIAEAAASRAVLVALLGALAVGAALVLPSLALLYWTFQRSSPRAPT